MPSERERDLRESRILETSVPGVLQAGTFTAGVERTFWDVHNPDSAISIKLRSTQELFSGLDDRFDELIVEVADPAETVDWINRALHGK